MKTTSVSHLDPFPGGYLQTPLLPSSSKSALRKAFGVAAVSVGSEQDCVTLVTPQPPCAYPNPCHTVHIHLSWLLSRGPEKLCRGCRVTQGWALSPSLKIQAFTGARHQLPQCSGNPRPIQTPQAWLIYQCLTKNSHSPSPKFNICQDQQILFVFLFPRSWK